MHAHEVVRVHDRVDEAVQHDSQVHVPVVAGVHVQPVELARTKSAESAVQKIRRPLGCTMSSEQRTCTLQGRILAVTEVVDRQPHLGLLQQEPLDSSCSRGCARILLFCRTRKMVQWWYTCRKESCLQDFFMTMKIVSMKSRTCFVMEKVMGGICIRDQRGLVIQTVGSREFHRKAVHT